MLPAGARTEIGGAVAHGFWKGSEVLVTRTARLFGEDGSFQFLDPGGVLVDLRLNDLIEIASSALAKTEVSFSKRIPLLSQSIANNAVSSANDSGSAIITAAWNERM
jgi:hypothetical protein